MKQIKTYGNISLNDDVEKGCLNNPYSMGEYQEMAEAGNWNGGYVEGANYMGTFSFIPGTSYDDNGQSIGERKGYPENYCYIWSINKYGDLNNIKTVENAAKRKFQWVEGMKLTNYQIKTLLQELKLKTNEVNITLEEKETGQLVNLINSKDDYTTEYEEILTVLSGFKSNRTVRRKEGFYLVTTPLLIILSDHCCVGKYINNELNCFGVLDISSESTESSFDNSGNLKTVSISDVYQIYY